MPATPETSRVTLKSIVENSRANNFTVIRLVAAAGVIFSHSFALSLRKPSVQDPLMNAVGFSNVGEISVDVFFLISGILVTDSLLREQNVILFLLKRFFRIFPALLVCLTCTSILLVALFHEAPYAALTSGLVSDYIKHNAALQMHYSIPELFDGRYYSAVNGSLWSLVVEVRAYIFLAFIGAVGLSQSRLLIVSSVSLLVVLMIAQPSIVSSIWVTPAGIIAGYFFLAGIICRVHYDEISITPIHVAGAAVFCAVVYQPLFQIALFMLVGVGTLYLAGATWGGRALSMRNDLSYGVYLYGWPTQQAIVTSFPGIGPYELFVFALTVSVMLAYVSWFYVEKLALDAGRVIVGQLRSWKVAADGGEMRRVVVGLAVPSACVLIIGGLALGERYAAPPKVEHLAAKIVSFGPTVFRQGQPFNVQPNGASAMWFKASAPLPKDATIVFDDQPLVTQISGDVATAVVPLHLISSVGKKRIRLEVRTATTKFLSDPIEVEIIA